jgi:hypothetical protein
MDQPAMTSDDVIDALVQAMGGLGGIDKTTLAQALEGLVRLAQAEQLLRMQIDFNRATEPLGHAWDGMTRSA